MMGRSFDDPEKASSKPKGQGSAKATDPPATNNGFGFFSIAESQSPSDAESHSSGTQPSPETDGWVFETDSTMIGEEVSQLGFNLTEKQDTAVVHVPRGTSAADYTPSPWGLVDPLLKDLSQFSRYYVHHCKNFIQSFEVAPLITPVKTINIW
jgi:hypothetical protein